jgi:mRNA interferase MazF
VIDAAPRRGEVWLAEVDKVRPVVILRRDPLAGLLHTVIVAPITSTVRGLSTEVGIGHEDGVRRESVANLDNVQPVVRTRLIRRVGRARRATMAAICLALDSAVGRSTAGSD